MSTYYTHTLEKREMSLAEFAWRCAEQFGALISLRDAPDDTPIPSEVKPDDYHLHSIQAGLEEIGRLEALTDAEAVAQSKAEYQSGLKAWREGKVADEAQCARARKLLAEVQAWEPPTPEHVELKEFMVQLLEGYTKPLGYYQKEPEEPDHAKWRADRLIRERDYVKRHERAYQKSVEVAKKRTAWIQALWKQIGPPPRNDR